MTNNRLAYPSIEDAISDATIEISRSFGLLYAILVDRLAKQGVIDGAQFHAAMVRHLDPATLHRALGGDHPHGDSRLAVQIINEVTELVGHLSAPPVGPPPEKPRAPWKPTIIAGGKS